MSTASPKSPALTPEEHCDCVLSHYGHIQDVWKELGNAIEKHPHFVDRLIPPADERSPEWYAAALGASRDRLSEATRLKYCDFHHVLECEAYEAFDAYIRGDLAHARQELAQCAAVCIRSMEYIDNELKQKGGVE